MEAEMLADVSNYIAPNTSFWQGRADTLDGERFFQCIQCVDVQSESLNKAQHSVILGFCSDEGIRRNSGRTGAKEGPDQLRLQLGKLAYHGHQKFIDVGNIICSDDNLKLAQEQFSNLMAYCHQHTHHTIAFGGGHEIAWPHFLGLAQHYPKIGMINLDAHFDIRPPVNHIGTSGTPFWQIKEYCDQHDRLFDYCCLGIQPTANTKSLLSRAQEWNISYLTGEQINQESFAWQTAFLDDFLLDHDTIYLSICLDVFSESFAPGVSAPQAIGLNPWKVLPLLKYIKQTGKVVSLDIAELSPPLDQHHKTARLAAMIIAEFLNDI